MWRKISWPVALAALVTCAAFAQERKTEGNGPEKKTVAETKKRLLEDLKEKYQRDNLEIQDLKMKTEEGDTASGVVVSESAEQISIDTTPCEYKKSIVVFHRVYAKEEVSSITCDSNEYQRVQVTQK